MTWTDAVENLIILSSSFAVGIVIYWMMSNAEKIDKKARVNWLFSMVIQLVIYIWIAKGLILFPTLIKDPLAVLAYPSNTLMFYLALLFTAIHIAVHLKKNIQPGAAMIEVFVPVFISTHFVYECAQLVQTNRVSFLISASILLVFVFIYISVKTIHTPTGYLILMSSWAVAGLLLSLLFSHQRLFSYTVSPVLYVVLVVGAGWLLWKMKVEKEL